MLGYAYVSSRQRIKSKGRNAMKFRRMLGIAAVGAVLVVGTGSGAAHASATCTWGGTPAAPTGHTTNNPGLTNFPAPGPLTFYATGVLAGDRPCTGKLSFSGQMDAGSTCGLISFTATVKGLPGVVRVAGFSGAGIAPARLFDKAGGIVGSENAQFATNAPFTDCDTPQGFTEGNFSSVIEL